MLQHTSHLAILLLLGTVPAIAQSTNIVDFKPEKVGTFHQVKTLYFGSSISDTMTPAPFGHADADTKLRTIAPFDVRMQQAGETSPVDLYTNPPDVGTWLSGRGAEFSICPWQGCPRSPPQDILRAQQYIRFRTKAGSVVGETALAIDSYMDSGYTELWKPNAAYVVGDTAVSGTSVYGNGNIYKVIQAGTSARTTGPDGIGSNIADGSVRWKYVNAPALVDQKIGLSEMCTTGPNAGATWCGARNLIIGKGSKGRHFSNTELDVGNFAKDCNSKTANCYGIFHYGITRYPITAWQVFSTPNPTPEVGSPPDWAPNTVYAIHPNRGAPVRRNRAKYYVLTKDGTSASSDGPTGDGDDIVDGTAHWAVYNSSVPNGLMGGAAHVGLLFQGLNNIQNQTIADGTNSQIVLHGDPIGNHSTAFIQDQSTSTVSYQPAGANSYATINDRSTSPFGILQEGNYLSAAYKYRGAVIGNWSANAAYQVISLNGSLGTGFLNGWFGSTSDPVLYGNARAAYSLRISDTQVLSIEPNRLTASGVINTPFFTPPNSSSACVVGDKSNDADYAYFCTATNRWKRVALPADTW